MLTDKNSRTHRGINCAKTMQRRRFVLKIGGGVGGGMTKGVKSVISSLSRSGAQSGTQTLFCQSQSWKTFLDNLFDVILNDRSVKKSTKIKHAQSTILGGPVKCVGPPTKNFGGARAHLRHFWNHEHRDYWTMPIQTVKGQWETDRVRHVCCRVVF